MKKWKEGSYYVENLSDLGSEERPKIYKLIWIQPDPDQTLTYFERMVRLESVDDGTRIEVLYDDRYGRYPLLDANRIANLKWRQAEAQNVVNDCKFLLKQIAKLKIGG